MTRSVRAQSSVSLFRKARFERLEDRQVLSADIGLGHAGALPPAPATQEFNLAITGTQCNYSPLGLPSEMKGNLYVDNGQGPSATVIGTYDETLTPIFMSLAPGGAPQFVGTNGVATFTFDLSLGAPVALGSITTSDTSFIAGVGASGQLMVGSTGTITSSTGFAAGLSGGFASHSVVAMGASFDLHTSVHFTVQDPWGVSMTRTLDGLSAIDSLATHTFTPPTSGPIAHHTPSLGGHPTGSQSTNSGDQFQAAIDHVFGTLDDLWANA